MNKQELIASLDKDKNKFIDVATNIDLDASNRNIACGIFTGIIIAKNHIARLDEPNKPQADKVEVPQFVADWFEQHRDILDYSIWEACINSRADYDDLGETTSNEFYDWLINAGGEDGEHKRITLLVRMQDGYTVKQEPKWIVKTSDGYWVNSITSNLHNSKVIDFSDNERPSLIFLDKKTAEAVATLIDGSVEEV